MTSAARSITLVRRLAKVRRFDSGICSLFDLPPHDEARHVAQWLTVANDRPAFWE
jgi:hypothetical protein